MVGGASAGILGKFPAHLELLSSIDIRRLKEGSRRRIGMSEQEIYIEAMNRPDPADRRRFLDEACAGNEVLRERIESLIRQSDQLGSFLEKSPQPEATADVFNLAEKSGTQIGPYKLLQQIGEGGMGVVYMAEQHEPVKRRVALKIIKPGMDTRQVIARFEAERQALSLMDHPNIAKVLDAGTTESGRPYFVMELVKGQPITQYCDEKHLTPRQRLELLLPVCQAIQHAHQKGIIHRDIKPTNILVAEYDQQAVPKVIDFGVAKATSQALTEKTMFTGFGQIVGTLEYMSPEQAKVNQLDIDTRSDIYSLGVLMYELLTGSTPFDKTRLRSAAFDEMLRIIREEEPERPSTRLSSADTLPSIAANRSMEPGRLGRAIRGELDWIVMKALEKDRNRRYETASNLAADLQRYLNDEPVQACPPSAAYRLRKFARRNKAAIGLAGMVLFFLILLGSGIGWAVRDRTAREQQFAQERAARQMRVSGQLELILDEVARLQQAEKWSEALTSARRAESALAADEAPPDVQERARQALADLELVRRIEEIRSQSGTVWATLHGLTDNPKLRPLAGQAEQDYAAAFRGAGIDVDTLTVEETSKRITARSAITAAVLPALDDWVAVRSKVKDESATRRLIEVLRTADPDPWRQRVRDCLTHKDWSTLETLVSSPDLDRQPPATISFLSAALRQQAEADTPSAGGGNGKLGHRGFFLATDILRRAQWKYSADYWINLRLGTDLIWLRTPDDVRDGIGFLRAAVALRPANSFPFNLLGVGYAFLGQNDQAVECYRKAIELDPKYAIAHYNLGIALVRQGKPDEAITCYHKAIELDPKFAWANIGLGNALVRHGKPDEAIAEYRKAIELDSKFAAAHIGLGNALLAQKKLDEAIAEYGKAIDELDPNDSRGNNELAWLLATCPESKLRNAARAVELGKKAVELSPEDGTLWNTLGVAHYRNGDWKAAIEALKKSDELVKANHYSFNAFFLAMAHWQLGDKADARTWFDKAVEWMDAHAKDDAELIRFRAEAEELMKKE
jgi:serine/threonine protein kinase/Flp pilus assembly protein TadD